MQAISPDSVTGLVLWLKATDLVQADSTPVSSWPDASGLAHTFTQGTVARQPIYIANGVNGLPVVRFSPAGTPKRMQAVEFMDYENPAVFVVARTTSTGTIQRIFNDNGSVFAQFLWIGVSSADQAFFGVRDINNVSLSVVTLTMDQFRIIDMQVHGQSATFSSNGDATTLSDSTYVATTWEAAAGSPTLGTLTSSTTGNPMDGDLAEVIVFNSILLDETRRGIECYLSQKYGISVIQTCKT